MPDLTPGFNGLDKDNCKTWREILKFWDLMRPLLGVCRWVIFANMSCQSPRDYVGLLECPQLWIGVNFLGGPIVGFMGCIPRSKVHGANMGPTCVLSAPGGLYVGPMNLAIRVSMSRTDTQHLYCTDTECFYKYFFKYMFLIMFKKNFRGMITLFHTLEVVASPLYATIKCAFVMSKAAKWYL